MAINSRSNKKPANSLNDMSYMQHQIDRLRQEIEKYAAENNELKNLIKNSLAEEKIHRRDEAEKLTILEKENQCIKNEVKIQQA